jgi:hypothetical protein
VADKKVQRSSIHPFRKVREEHDTGRVAVAKLHVNFENGFHTGETLTQPHSTSGGFTAPTPRLVRSLQREIIDMT